MYVYVPPISRPRCSRRSLILMAQLYEGNVLHCLTAVGVSQGDGDSIEGGIS